MNFEELCLLIRDSLTGKECWAVIGGSGTGSMVSMSFGRKIPRARPLRNPNVCSDARLYNGEFGIFIQDSPWRIEASDKVICTSDSDNSKDGPMERGLKHLMHQIVESVEHKTPAGELILKFGGGTALKIFCDQVSLDKDHTNYSFFTERHSYSLDNARHVEIEELTLEY